MAGSRNLADDADPLLVGQPKGGHGADLLTGTLSSPDLERFRLVAENEAGKADATLFVGVGEQLRRWPHDATILPGVEQLVVAESASPVTWVASGGQLSALDDNRALFTADAPGVYLVTAHTTEDPVRSATTAIAVEPRRPTVRAFRGLGGQFSRAYGWTTRAAVDASGTYWIPMPSGRLASWRADEGAWIWLGDPRLSDVIGVTRLANGDLIADARTSLLRLEAGASAWTVWNHAIEASSGSRQIAPDGTLWVAEPRYNQPSRLRALVRISRLGALRLVLAQAACASITTMQPANTLGAKNVSLSLQPTYLTMLEYADSRLHVPRFDVALRYGVSETVDLGARLGFFGFDLGAKFQLTDPAKRSFVASLAPSVGTEMVPAGHAPMAAGCITVPLLLGFGTTEGGSHIVLGPRVVDMFSLFTSRTYQVLFAGSSLGYAVRVGGLTLVPEIGVLFPVLTLDESRGVGELVDAPVRQRTLFQAGIGVGFGL